MFNELIPHQTIHNFNLCCIFFKLKALQIVLEGWQCLALDILNHVLNRVYFVANQLYN